MDVDEFFLGPHHKIIKKKNVTKLNDDRGENHSLKCKADEIEQLLTVKKCLLQQLRYEK